jgi:hypothetical protein
LVRYENGEEGFFYVALICDCVISFARHSAPEKSEGFSKSKKAGKGRAVQHASIYHANKALEIRT